MGIPTMQLHMSIVAFNFLTLVTKMMLSKLKVKLNMHNIEKKYSPGYLMGRLCCIFISLAVIWQFSYLVFLTLDNVVLFYFSVNSFIELGCLLLNEDGVKFLFSEKLSQDSLEECFLKQQATGGVDENLTLPTFNNNFLGLKVAKFSGSESCW